MLDGFCSKAPKDQLSKNNINEFCCNDCFGHDKCNNKINCQAKHSCNNCYKECKCRLNKNDSSLKGDV